MYQSTHRNAQDIAAAIETSGRPYTRHVYSGDFCGLMILIFSGCIFVPKSANHSVRLVRVCVSWSDVARFGLILVDGI